MELHEKGHRTEQVGRALQSCLVATQERVPGEGGLGCSFVYMLALCCFAQLQETRSGSASLARWWLCTNSSALIYGADLWADHIFHKLKMTTSRHVLVNKSHRFWIFPLKQKQKQKSPNYILHYILNCFKHVLTSQKPGSSSFSVPICPILPSLTHPGPADADRAHQQSLWGCLLKGLSASSLHHRLEGCGGPSPEPHPSLGLAPTTSELSKPQVRENMNGTTAGAMSFQSTTTLASFFLLGWAHSPIVPWYPPGNPWANIQEKMPEETT